jgi:hypothetical protein
MMDFWALIDKLDDMVTSAKRVRLSSDVRVDKQSVRAIVGQLRGAIPDELREANWIAENRDEMLAEARSEVARILEGAREEKTRLLGQDAIAEGAQLRAQELLESAAESGDGLRLGAEQHALDILDALEAHLEKLAAAVGRGRVRLAERNPDQLIEREPDRLVASSGDRARERDAALA